MSSSLNESDFCKFSRVGWFVATNRLGSRKSVLAAEFHHVNGLQITPEGELSEGFRLEQKKLKRRIENLKDQGVNPDESEKARTEFQAYSLQQK